MKAIAGTLQVLAAAAICVWLTSAPTGLRGQSASRVVLQIKAGEASAKVSPKLYGLTEEINFSL